MLLLARHLYGVSVDASDGKLGKLIDFLFDDQSWRIQHLVLDGGRWLHRRRVTLPPDIVQSKDWADHRVEISGLTRQQVLDSPGAETHIPVAVHDMLADATIMDWETYWVKNFATDHPWRIADDYHVHNTEEVAGYDIHGIDGPIGRVADFVINDEPWTVSHLVVDTSKLWWGNHVLVPAARVVEIDGPKHTVRLTLSRESIRHSPSVDNLAACEN